MPDVYDSSVNSFGLKLTKKSDAKVTITFDGIQCYDITDLDEVNLTPRKSQSVTIINKFALTLLNSRCHLDTTMRQTVIRA